MERNKTALDKRMKGKQAYFLAGRRCTRVQIVRIIGNRVSKLKKRVIRELL